LATVYEGATVTLDGSTSSDPNGETLTYEWTSLNSSIILNDTTNVKQTFTAPPVDGDTDYTFELTVTNSSEISSVTESVIITVQHIKLEPIANANGPASVDEGTTNVTLNGSTSSDPETDH